jgi:hypothetical protein
MAALVGMVDGGDRVWNQAGGEVRGAVVQAGTISHVWLGEATARSDVVGDERLLTGSRVPLPAYAVDALGNPAADATQESVRPDRLARVETAADGHATLTAGAQAGRGTIAVRAGRAHGEVPLTVVDRLGSLSVRPPTPDVGNGASVHFAVTATAGSDTPVELPPAAVTWTVDPPALGSVDAATGRSPRRPRTANPYLARVLGEAAIAAGDTHTFLGERYRRIARRSGTKKAIVAVGRSFLVIIWHLLSDPDARFHDLGADLYLITPTPCVESATTSTNCPLSATTSPSNPPRNTQHPCHVPASAAACQLHGVSLAVSWVASHTPHS